jgi:hypothetical protein
MTALNVQAVPYVELVEGDTFTDGVSVTSLWSDDDGLWMETTDGSAGYVFNPKRKVYVLAAE